MAMMRRAAVAGIVLLLLSTASVSAASHQIEVFNFGYNPTPLKIPLSDSARWHNGSNRGHTASADLFGLFNENLATGATSANIAFQHAGTFAYHCNIHGSMHGKIKVKMSAAPATGTTSTTFVIRVATLNAPTGFTHDVQKRKAGGTFATWRATTGQTTTFTSSTKGTFEFRGRLRRTSDGTATGWSPIVSVKVN
jgi:plastocyanin